MHRSSTLANSPHDQHNRTSSVNSVAAIPSISLAAVHRTKKTGHSCQRVFSQGSVEMRLFIKSLEERIAPSRTGFFRLFSRIHDMAWSAHSSTEGATASNNSSFEHHQEVVASGDEAAATVVHNSGQGAIVADANGPVVVSDANHQQSVIAVSVNAGCVVKIQNDGNGFQSVVVTSD